MSIIARTDCTPRLSLEYAKSGRSACKFCLINIPQKQMRLGVTVYHKEKRSVPYTSWFHLSCLRFDVVPQHLETNEQRYCEECAKPVGVGSISCSVVERPSQYNIRHRIHPRCLALKMSSACKSFQYAECPGFDCLSKDAQIFVNALVSAWYMIDQCLFLSLVCFIALFTWPITIFLNTAFFA